MSAYTSTISTSGSTYVIGMSGGGGDRPKDAPAGLIATQAVQTKKGWRGQVIVDRKIVWEGKNVRMSETAIDQANKRLVDTISALFASPTP